MRRGHCAAVILAALSLARAGRAWAGEAAEAPADCGAPPEQRPPDPRCGETLDGRVEPEATAARQVARGGVWVPRLTSRVLFWPIVEASDVIEAYHVPNWLDAILSTDDGKVGVRPIVQYATGFLPSGGLRVFYRRLPGPGTEIAARFQTAGPYVLLGQVDVAGPRWSGLAMRAAFNRRDDRLFAGVGPNSEADLLAQGRGASRFGSDAVLAELRWSHSLPQRLSVGLHGDAQRRDYRANEVRGGASIATLYGLPTAACAPGTSPSNACVDPVLVPGFVSGLRIAHAGAALGWDLRRHARDGGGFNAFFDATGAEGLAGDPSRHITFTGEAVLAVGGNDRLLLVRGRAAVVRRLGAAPIPFEELIMISGNAGMRGYPDGRFRGLSGVVGSAEYRWYIAHHLDASLFSDVGTVGGAGFAGLDTARWFPTFGVGLRHVTIHGPYWEGDVDTGVQLAYAPGYGFRLLLSVATF